METLFGLEMQYLAAGLSATLLILILAIAIIASATSGCRGS